MCKQPSHCLGNVPSWGQSENMVQKFPRYQLYTLLSPFPVLQARENLQRMLGDVWQLTLSRAGFMIKDFAMHEFFFQLITIYQQVLLISVYQISSFSS